MNCKYVVANKLPGKGRFFPVTEQEASAFPELTTLPATGKYYMEYAGVFPMWDQSMLTYCHRLDTFHSLHCLNDIRRELDHEYYSQHDNHHSWEYLLKPARIHMGMTDYCLDRNVLFDVAGLTTTHQIILSPCIFRKVATSELVVAPLTPVAVSTRFIHGCQRETSWKATRCNFLGSLMIPYILQALNLVHPLSQLQWPLST